MPTVIFRGSPTSDPEDAEALESVLKFDHFPDMPKYLGAPVMFGDGLTRGTRPYRVGIVGELTGVYRSADVSEQDYGQLRRFHEQVRLMPFLFIWRVYEDAIGGSPAARADYDRSDLTVTASANTTWYAKTETGDGYPFDEVQGHLPMLVQCTSDPAAEYEGGSIYGETIEFMSEDVYRRT